MFNALHKKVQKMKTQAEHKFQHQQVRKLIEELGPSQITIIWEPKRIMTLE